MKSIYTVSLLLGIAYAQIEAPLNPLPGSALPKAPKVPVPVSSASTVVPELLGPTPGQTGIPYGGLGKEGGGHSHGKRQVPNPASTLPQISPPPSPVLPSGATPKIPIPVSTPLGGVDVNPKAADPPAGMAGMAGMGHAHGRRQVVPNPAATLPSISPPPSPVLPSGATPKIPIPVSTPAGGVVSPLEAAAGPKAGQAGVAYGGLGKAPGGHSHGR